MATRKTSAKATKATDEAVEVASSADVVDAQLARYRSMRDFHVTAEPAGAAKDGTARAGLPFCIQKHAASHLHYDFRLGWNGVLKSWACAKGPSYVVADKRLAVEVEDHPIEYGGFEGIIPKGQYGGGTVMLWDQGTWEPQEGHTDVDAGLKAGQLKFVMHGEKIRGKWALIRMGGKAAAERKPNWLLIKEHDEFERPEGAPSVTETEDRSVATGRTMEEIARQEDHVWNSKETAGTGQAWYRKEGSGSEASTAPVSGTVATIGAAPAAPAPAPTATVAKKKAKSNGLAAKIDDLPEEPQPSFIKPQLASEAMAAPEGNGWLYELKLDGYRMQARKNGDTVEMLTRSGLDWTYRVPAVAEAVARLPVGTATLDGEVVVLRDDGTTNFADLQASFQEGARNPLTFFCFDLLHVEGRNPRGLPLRERKKLLAEVMAGGDGDQVRLSEDIEGAGETIFKQACELHAEGVLAKRAAAPYYAGRNSDWVKLKCLLEQEFAVGGYTVSSDGEDRVGSLLLGYYRDGKLVYAGRTGTGFTQRMRRMLMERLGPMRVTKAAYAVVPAEAKRDAVWVRPELVAQVRFATWTADDVVRQAAFLGLREDKAAREVRREEATVAPKPKAERGPRAVAPVPAAAEKFHVRGRVPRSAKEEEAAAKVVDGRIRAGAAPALVKGAAVSAKATEAEHAPVRLTHPAKVLDAESGVTKQMLADFYWAVAERMLPHIANRPLSLVRCPEGSTKPCFYQKHVNHMLPKGITGVDVPDKKTGVPEQYITLDSAEALAGLAQMGVLEVHPWGSCNEDLEHANRLIFDLDPDEALGWEQVAAAAVEVRAALKKIGLESFLKTTGGKGLHLVVPVAPTMDWNAVKEFARQFVVSLERANPKLYLTKMSKAARVGKIYLDYLRNERGATAVAPYSPRARAGMPVSVPMAWSELKGGERPRFAVANFGEWRARLKKDPWKGIEGMRQEVRPERLRER